MEPFLIAALVLTWLAIAAGCWFGWQLLRQNGRLLLRFEEIEERLDEVEFGGLEAQPASNGIDETANEEPAIQIHQSEIDRALLVPHNGTAKEDRGSRFGNRSLTRSRIKRDGLKAGTPAPDFRLSRLDGRGELSLRELRAKRVLLVFSDPHCGPCNALAPELEKFHRHHPETELLMISKGETRENLAKIREHGLTFPIVLQQQWEISRRYAMFATPIAYLIDEAGIIENDVAVGVEPILALLAGAAREISKVEPLLR